MSSFLSTLYSTSVRLLTNRKKTHFVTMICIHLYLCVMWHSLETAQITPFKQINQSPSMSHESLEKEKNRQKKIDTGPYYSCWCSGNFLDWILFFFLITPPLPFPSFWPSLPPWCKLLSLPSLPLLQKSKMTAIIFTMKILSTRVPKSSLLWRLGGKFYINQSNKFTSFVW